MITATSLRSHDHGYTGSLRVGLISVPVHSIRDPYSGELRGVSHDLGRELARRHQDEAGGALARRGVRFDLGRVTGALRLTVALDPHALDAVVDLQLGRGEALERFWAAASTSS